MTPEEVEGGVLLIDKPEGVTSHDVVNAVRSAIGIRRVGHTGTLDPFATGLLLVCYGVATRLAEYFHLLDKGYHAVLRLGVETDTHDPAGTVVTRSDGWRDLDAAAVESALERFEGEIEQRPPAYSAKKVEGERAHRRVRAGRSVELSPTRVRIDALELVGWEPPDAELRAVVSTGTYVRAIARDVGRELGTGGHLRRLRRTRIGPFRVDDAVAPDEARVDSTGTWRRTPAEALDWLPRRSLSASELTAIVAGRRITAAGAAFSEVAVGGAQTAARPVVLVHGDRLVGIAERRGEELQPRKILWSADSAPVRSPDRATPAG